MALCSAPTWQIGGVLQTAWCLCFVDFLHPASGLFPQQFRGAHRTWQALWDLGFRSQTLGLWVLFVAPLRGRTIPTRGYRLLVGVVLRRKAGTSWGTRPYRRCGRWNIVSWFRGACTASSWGTYSGGEALWEGKSGRWGPSSLTHSLHLSLSPSLEPSVRKLAGLLRRPGSVSSQTSGLLWINPGPWWSCGKWWRTWGGSLYFLSETEVRRSPPSHCTYLLVGSWCWPSKSPTFRWHLPDGCVGVV